MPSASPNANKTLAEKRKRGERVLKKLQARQRNEDRARIASLTAALQKSDEELKDADIDEHIDAMDLDEKEDETGGIDNGDSNGNRNGSNSSNSDDIAADKTTTNTAGSTSDRNADAKTSPDVSNANHIDSNTASSTANDTVNHGVSNASNTSGTSTIKQEPQEDDSPLFVPNESGTGNSDENTEQDLPLFVRPGPQHGKDVKTVGWAGGRRTQYLNMYGKKSAARYRLEGSADSAEYEDTQPPKEKVSNPNNRYGDRLLDNGKFEFTKRHIHAIFGVAWEGAGTDDMDDDLDLIDPALVGTSEKRWPITYVLIAWDISGEITKKWEPRQALRARWGKKDADKAIFSAACEAEGRYSEAMTGKRLAMSRSPSVGLAEETTRKFRQQSLPARKSPRSHRNPSLSRSKSPRPRENTVAPDLVQALKDFRIDYCECAGVDSFDDFDSKEKAEFVEAWKHAKAKLAA